MEFCINTVRLGNRTYLSEVVITVRGTKLWQIHEQPVKWLTVKNMDIGLPTTRTV